MGHMSPIVCYTDEKIVNKFDCNSISIIKFIITCFYIILVNIMNIKTKEVIEKSCVYKMFF